MKVKSLILIVITATALVLCGCNGKKVYDVFVHTPRSGWEKNDHLSFFVPKQLAGDYSMTLQMRTDNAFPFKSVQMIVDSQILPSGRAFSDTLICDIADDQGYALGHGINIYQHSYEFRRQRLAEGDSLVLHVHHNMKREMLPGITDVGIMIDRIAE